jgi:long-chain acyl-CoA synthetase
LPESEQFKTDISPRFSGQGPGVRTVRPLIESLLAHADAAPERIAFSGGDSDVTYGAFAKMIAAAAARITDTISQRGERVVLCGSNSPQLAAAYFAIHAAGGVAVLLDAATPAETFRWIVEDAEPRLILCAAGFQGAAQTGNLAGVHVEDLAAFTSADASRPHISPRVALDADADLIYTTGTTGRRKGVLLSHENIAQAAVNIHSFIGTTADDREVMPLPLSHSFGLGRLRVMAHVGHCLLLVAGMRNPAAVLKLLLDSKATGLALVPAGFDLILRMTRDRLGDARPHLRYVEIGSAAMPLTTREKLMELLPDTRLCHHYGLTEASRAAFLEYHADRNHLGSIGRPSPNVEMAVRDDQGRDVPDGEVGQIVVCGRMVMRRYWKQPELTDSVLHDGWFSSGDFGRRDVNGYYHLTGRQANVVNVGGRKVNPEEVEEALNAHPAVVESACTGAPDPDGIVGECLKAFVVLRSDARVEQLIEFLRGRLEEYKIPRLWQRVDRIARTESGKIQRRML